MTNLPEKKQGIITEAGGQTTINNPEFNFYPPQKPATAVKFIPNRGIHNFVGREEELKILHEKLHIAPTVAISAVAGMGGIGKTELATQYARNHENDYPGGIYWINAREANIAAGIIEFVTQYMGLKVPQGMGGRAVSLEEQVTWCWQNWQPPAGLVLVVLDDVTDWESCEHFLPSQNRFRVLMTTRLRNLEPSLVEEVPLDVLSLPEAVELLTKLVGEKRVNKNIVDARKLCEWLGYLPLGIQLVGAYLKNDPDLSLSEMLESLKAQSIDDEALNQKHKGVKAAFELTWKQLNSTAQQVAEYLSLFSPNIIPWQYVEKLDETSLQITIKDIKDAKKQLYRHHLIQPLEEVEGCYKIHPLIREFLQGKLNQSSTVNDFKQSFTTTFIPLAQEFPETPILEDINAYQFIIPHLTEVAQNHINIVADEDLIWVFVGLGRFYEGQGLYALAEP